MWNGQTGYKEDADDGSQAYVGGKKKVEHLNNVYETSGQANPVMVVPLLRRKNPRTSILSSETWPITLSSETLILVLEVWNLILSPRETKHLTTDPELFSPALRRVIEKKKIEDCFHTLGQVVLTDP